MEAVSSSETLVFYLPNYTASYPKILILVIYCREGLRSHAMENFLKILHSAYLDYEKAHIFQY
jgi:hypothetical protein